MNFQSSIVYFFLSLNLIAVGSAPLDGEDYSEEFVLDLPEEYDLRYQQFKYDNSDELGEYFEGDIILNGDQEHALIGNSDRGRTGRINERYRWNTTIPYEIDPQFTTLQITHILLGMADIEAATCLTFTPKAETDVDYVFFNSNATGCSSPVGRQGGRNRISLKPNTLGSGCFKSGTIVHEIIHTLGFYHMQSASDRDSYIQIIWENILPGHENNFRYYDETLITHFGIPYDYNSVMHYGPTAFTANGNYTIIPLDPEAEIGQRLAMTESDIARINAMYCSNPEPVSELEVEDELEIGSDIKNEAVPDFELQIERELEAELVDIIEAEDVIEE